MCLQRFLMNQREYIWYQFASFVAYNLLAAARRGSRGGEMGEFSPPPPPPFSEPPSFFFSDPSNIEIIFDYIEIIFDYRNGLFQLK